MHKSTMIMVAAMAVTALPMWADEVGSVQRLEEGKADYHGIELSTRVGVRDYRANDIYEPGPAVQVEIRIPLGESDFDINARGYYAWMGADDGFGSRESGSYYGYVFSEVETVDDGDVQTYGGSLQLQYNFARGEAVNPYVAAGWALEKCDYSVEGHDDYYFGSLFLKRESWKLDGSDDGNAFVGRVGLEFNLDKLWLLAECAYMTEFYEDGDDAQFVGVGRFGYCFTDSCRFDIGIDYYVEWEDLFVSVGLGFLL